jgi:DNA repair protein RadD
MAGRGLRPALGKTNLILIDHSGAVYRHGLLEDRVEWTLHTDRRANNSTHAARDRGTIGRLVECSQCGAMRTGGEKCPHCGFLPQRRPDAIVFREGELARVKYGEARSMLTPEDRLRWHGMLRHIAGERGYKPGWVAHKFKEKFGDWPAARHVPSIVPSPEVLSWVRSRSIAYAKARKTA